ncbi:MAG: metalloregulator ArsR/SmtB family transcription factor [Caulobacteraceae bacterium]|nr:metalloregulator ArsR/SmtB family transcription factor [Caulobacteraceae bacterium]
MEMTSAIESLSALAHEGRLKAFRLLVSAGPSGVAAGEIARRLETPPNTLSANLSLLVHAGLVQSRRDGRSIIYSARFGRMGELLSFLAEDCCAGAPEVCGPVAAAAQRAACRPVT